MKPRMLATGIAAAAVLGSVSPAWAFWTVTSDPTATAAAKAATLSGNAPTVVSSRTQGGGVNLVVSFTVVAPPAGGAVPSSYRVERLQQSGGPTPVCIITGATGTCMNEPGTGTSNNGDKSFLVTALVGNWVSASSVCDYENNGIKPEGPANFMCSGPAPTSMALRVPDPAPPSETTPAAEEAETKKSKQSAPASQPSTPVAPTPSTGAATPTPPADTTAPTLTATAIGEGATWTITGRLGTASGDVPDVALAGDNGAALGAPVVAADGTFSATVTAEVGTTTVTVTQVDAAGNTASVSVTIVRDAPAAPTEDGPAAAETTQSSASVPDQSPATEPAMS